MKTYNIMKYSICILLLALCSLEVSAQNISFASVPSAQLPSAQMGSTSSQIGRASRSASAAGRYTPQVSYSGGSTSGAAGILSGKGLGSQRRGSANLGGYSYGGYAVAGTFSAMSSTPSLNDDGTASVPSISGPQKANRDDGEGNAGTPSPIIPSNQLPLGDGHWFLLVLAAAFAALHIFLSRKEKKDSAEQK